MPEATALPREALLSISLQDGKETPAAAGWFGFRFRGKIPTVTKPGDSSAKPLSSPLLQGPVKGDSYSWRGEFKHEVGSTPPQPRAGLSWMQPARGPHGPRRLSAARWESCPRVSQRLHAFRLTSGTEQGERIPIPSDSRIPDPERGPGLTEEWAGAGTPGRHLPGPRSTLEMPDIGPRSRVPGPPGWSPHLCRCVPRGSSLSPPVTLGLVPKPDLSQDPDPSPQSLLLLCFLMLGGQSRDRWLSPTRRPCLACGRPSPGGRKPHVPCTEPNSAGPGSLAAGQTAWWGTEGDGHARTRGAPGDTGHPLPEPGLHTVLPHCSKGTTCQRLHTPHISVLKLWGQSPGGVCRPG